MEQQERHYNINKLNRLFAIASGILLLAMVWMFADDYSREWKDYQKRFQELEIEKTRVKYDLSSHDLEKNAQYQQLKSQLEAAQKAAQAKSEELKTIEQKIEKLRASNDIIKQKSRFAKAQYDSIKYLYEDAIGHHKSDQEIVQAKQALESIEKEVGELRVKEEASDRELNTQLEKSKSFNQEIKKIEREQGALSRQVDILKRKLVRIDPAEMTPANQAADMIRNLPVIDLANPTFKIEQVVLKDLTDDVNFMRVPKVDRCITCHQGITNSDYKDAPQPFTTHPNLELFLASDSAHPMEEFGCTTCHGGRGRGTDFNSTGHTPSTPEQVKEWEEKYDWHPIHHWETPMYPKQYVEAGCFKCHAGQEVIKGAEKLNLGLNLVEKAGCYACHTIEKYKTWPRPGPDLTKIASKASKKWAYQWIKDPKSFRHDTWMPSFFGQFNNSDPASEKRANQEIHAMVYYLFAHSADYKAKELPVPGDPIKGKELVASIGCFGCHDIDRAPKAAKTTRLTLMREHGPNLLGLGSKTTKSWLYNWLKNPKNFNHKTRMPDLRLTDEEAADIASYLINDTNEEFITKELPPVDENQLNEIVKEFLVKMTTVAQADVKIAQMNLDEKMEFAGQKLIRHYGCFGCHEIKGFENDKPIGTELTEWGSKTADKLDFGFVHAGHTNSDFAEMKLKDPRIFDKDRLREPTEKLRMPNFHFTDEEIEAIVTVLLGLTKDHPPSSKMVSRTPKNLFIEDGQRIVREFNCQGCHIMEGEGGSIKPTVIRWLMDYDNQAQNQAEAVAVSFSPPNLIGEGKKVQAEWLFEFLHKPELIRPWLKARMPTFHFDAPDINSLVKYFNFLDDEEFPFAEPIATEFKPDELAAGAKLFSDNYFGCAKCHIVGSQMPGGSPDSWAPNFALAKKRLKPKWLAEWIKNPQALMPGTKMPTFFDPKNFDTSGPDDILNGDEQEQIRVLRDFLMTLEDSALNPSQKIEAPAQVPAVSETPATTVDQ